MLCFIIEICNVKKTTVTQTYARGSYAASQTTVLHMKGLSKTESPIFMILCVLCFQSQSFFTFILHSNTPARVVPYLSLHF